MYMYIILHLASSYYIRAYEMNKGTIFYKNAVGSKLSGKHDFDFESPRFLVIYNHNSLSCLHRVYVCTSHIYH